MEFIRLACLWPEKKGFLIDRVNKENEYVFINCLTPVEIFEDGKMKHFEKNTCVLYEKGAYQKFASPSCDLIHNWFHVVGDIDGAVADSGILFNHVYVLENSDFILNIMQQIEIEYLNKRKHYEKVCQSLLSELLYKIDRNSQWDSNESPVSYETELLFIKLRSKVLATYNEPWSAEKMAKEVNLSFSRFYELYKKIFSISPNQDLIKIKLEHAKILLVESDKKISTVASQVGFLNEYHFIRQFKKSCGMTPGKFRVVKRHDFS